MAKDVVRPKGCRRDGGRVASGTRVAIGPSSSARDHGARYERSSAYWESGQAQARAAGQAPPPVSIPVAFTTFPGEIFPAPRSWVELSYPTLTYFNEVDRGGHFAAWEEPELFSEEIRAAFRSLR
jgi:pimeloyl-ACP methyl ester carboxylesterase